MTVKLTYRELQRISSGELLKRLGENVGEVSVNGEVKYEIKVVKNGRGSEEEGNEGTGKALQGVT